MLRRLLLLFGGHEVGSLLHSVFERLALKGQEAGPREWFGERASWCDGTGDPRRSPASGPTVAAGAAFAQE